jgi:hypothetical protein
VRRRPAGRETLEKHTRDHGAVAILCLAVAVGGRRGRARLESSSRPGGDSGSRGRMMRAAAATGWTTGQWGEGASGKGRGAGQERARASGGGRGRRGTATSAWVRGHGFLYGRTRALSAHGIGHPRPRRRFEPRAEIPRAPLGRPSWSWRATGRFRWIHGVHVQGGRTGIPEIRTP